MPAVGVEFSHHWERLLLAVDLTLAPTAYRQTDYMTGSPLRDGTAWWVFVSVMAGTSFSP